LSQSDNNSFYKLKISYFGKDFSGWQKQKSGEKTIQGVLEAALQKTSNSALVNSIGSGRTDAGVNALGQIVRVEMLQEFPVEMFVKGVNNNLPPTIRVLEAEKSSENFHPVFGSKSKTYKYIFGQLPSRPFLEGLYCYYSKDLNVSLMNKGASLFEGEHDFCNYFCTGTDVRSTVRKIFKCSFKKVESINLGFNHIWGDFYELNIIGEGFLKQMVRLIVGTLISLNEGKIDLDDIQTSLQVPLRKKLGITAPSEGLYLESVEY